MKRIFKNKKWIAFLMALILVVGAGVSSSDAFLWASGGDDETAQESTVVVASDADQGEETDQGSADNADLGTGPATGTQEVVATNPDGTPLETPENPDGTPENPDGTPENPSGTPENPDGVTVITPENPDGVTVITPTDPNGTPTEGTEEGADQTDASLGVLPGEEEVLDPDAVIEEEIQKVEVPTEVKSFVEEMAKLPEAGEITEDNAAEVFETLGSDALSDGYVLALKYLEELEDQEDEEVKAACDKYEAVYRAAEEILELLSSMYAETVFEIKGDGDGWWYQNGIAHLNKWLTENKDNGQLTIRVMGSGTLNGGLVIPAGADVVVESYGGNLYRSEESGGKNAPMFQVNGKLTLRNITVDGCPQGADSSAKRSNCSIVCVESGGTLILENNSYLQHNQFPGETGKGGAVYVNGGGNLVVNSGATIKECYADEGGAIYLESGATATVNSSNVTGWSKNENSVIVYVAKGATFHNNANIGGVYDASVMNGSAPLDNVKLVVTILTGVTTIPNEPSVSNLEEKNYKWVNGSYNVDSTNAAFSNNAADHISKDIFSDPNYKTNGNAQGVSDTAGKYLNIDLEKLLNAVVDKGVTTKDGNVLTARNKDKYEVYPYVAKYQYKENDAANGWHVDCIIVPKDQLKLIYQLNLQGQVDDLRGFLAPAGNTYSSGTEVTVESVKYRDSEVEVGKEIKVTKGGKEASLYFWGWSTSENGEAVYKPGDIFTITKNTTLYGVWTTEYAPHEIHYTVEYYKNGVMDDTETVTRSVPSSQTTLTVKPIDEEKYKSDGYVFDHYEIDGEKVDLPATVPNRTIIRAYYIPSTTTKQYTVEYYKNDGDGYEHADTESIEGVPVNDTMLNVDASKVNTTDKYPGYALDYINTKNNTTVPTIVPVNGTIKVYYKVIEYTITYVLDGGELEAGKTNPEKYTVNDEVNITNEPTRENYTFVGWVRINEDGTYFEGDTPQKPVTFGPGVTGDRTYKAVWETIPTSYQIITYYKDADGKIITEYTTEKTIANVSVGDEISYEEEVVRAGIDKENGHYALEKVDLEVMNGEESESTFEKTLGQLQISNGTATFSPETLEEVYATDPPRIIKIYYALDAKGPNGDVKDDIPDYLEHSVTYKGGNGGKFIGEDGTERDSYSDSKLYPEGATVTLMENQFVNKSADDKKVAEFAKWVYEGTENFVDPTTTKTITMGDADVTLLAQWKSMAVTKTHNEPDVPEGKEKKFDLGKEIIFTIEVTNDGDVDLTDVEVTDTFQNEAVIVPDENTANPAYTVSKDGTAKIESLKKDATVTVYAKYTVKESDIQAVEGEDGLTNTARATAGNAHTEGETDVPIAGDNKDVRITKAIDASKGDAPGENGKYTTGNTVYFTIKVENFGNRTLENITVSEELFGAKFTDGNADDPAKKTIASLAPGASVELEAFYVVTESDLGTDLKNIVTAKVEGKEDPKGEVDIPVDGKKPAFSVAKNLVAVTRKASDNKETVNGTGTVEVKVGDTIHYEVVVENTGNMDLYNVEVSDTIAAVGRLGFKGAVTRKDGTETPVDTGSKTAENDKTDVRTIDKLPIGATVVLKYDYKVQDGDAKLADTDGNGNKISNTATVTTTKPGDTDPTSQSVTNDQAEVEKKYTLTVHYTYKETGDKAADDTTKTLLEGASHEITLPVIEGYEAELSENENWKIGSGKLTGTMPKGDKEVTVYYVAREDLNYEVRYHYSDDGETQSDLVTERKPASGGKKFGERFFDKDTDVAEHKTYNEKKYILDVREAANTDHKGIVYGASNGIVSAIPDNNTVDVYYVLDANDNKVPDYLEHQVIFQLNGGTAVVDGTVDAGPIESKKVYKGGDVYQISKIYTLADPTKAGSKVGDQNYAFAGWTPVSPNGVTLSENGEFTMPSEDMVFKAQWKGLSVHKEEAGKAPDGGYPVGTDVTFTITVTNIGDVELKNVVVMDEKTDAKITGVTIDGTAVTDVTTGSSEVTLSMLAPKASAVITVTYTVTETDKENAKNNGFKNKATASTDGVEVKHETPDIPIEGVEKHLTVTKAIRTKTVDGKEIPDGANGFKDGKAAFKIGDTVTFDVTITNDGKQDLTGITVTDAMVDATITKESDLKDFFKNLLSGIIGKIVANAKLEPGKPVTIDSLESGASVKFEVKYTIADTDIGRDFRNVVTAEATDGTTNWDESEKIPVEEQNENISVEKRVTSKGEGDGGKYEVGKWITYEIVVKNTGNVALKGVIVEDKMTATADGEKPQDISSLIVGGHTSVEGGEATYGNGVTWDAAKKEFRITEIPVDGSVTISYKYLVRPEDAGKTIQNEAVGKVDGEKKDSDTPDNKPVVEKRSLTVEKVLLDKDGNPIAKDDLKKKPFGVGTLTFKVTVKNTGNVELKDVTVDDTMWAVKADGTRVSKTAILAEDCEETFDLLVGDVKELTYTYEVTEDDLGLTLYNAATASGGNKENPDEVKTDEVGPIKVDNAHPKVSVKKTIAENSDKPNTETGMYKVGDTIRYQIVVTNKGNTTLKDVVVKDTMTGAAGKISNVVGAEYKELETEHVYEFKIAEIPVKDPADSTKNGSATITYEYVVFAGDAGKEIGNTARVDNVPVDPDPVNPVNPDPVEVEERELTVEKERVNAPADGKAYQTGEEIIFAVTVTNSGNVEMTGINLVDTMQNATGSAEAVTVTQDADGKYVATPVQGGEHSAFDLAAGDSETRYYRYTVQEGDIKEPGAADAVSVTNKVTAKADSKDWTDTTEPIPIGEQAPAYTVRKAITNMDDAKDGKFAVGDRIAYKITVENTGNVTLQKITVDDFMTGATGTIDKDSVNGATWDEASKHFTIDEIPVKDSADSTKRGSATITYEYEVLPGDAGKTIRNTAGFGPGQNPDDPNKEQEVVIEKRALTVEKRLVGSPANGVAYMEDETMLFSVTVNNTGNVTLKNIKVTDEMQNAAGDAEAVKVTEDGNGGYTIGETVKDGHTIASLESGKSATVYYSYTVQKDDLGKTDIRNKVTALSKNDDPSKEDTTGEDTTGELPVDGEYTLTVRYVYAADNREAAPTYMVKLMPGEDYLVYSPIINGYDSSAAFVAGKMPGRDLELVVYYTVKASENNPGGGGDGGDDDPTPPTPDDSTPDNPTPPTPVNPTPGTPTPGTPTPGNPTPVNPTVGGGIPVVVTPEQALVGLGDDAVPLGAYIDVDDDGNVVVTTISEEEVPLAGGVSDDHKCCILSFLLMLAALIVYTCYTCDMKKRQKRLAELAEELEEETLKKELGISDAGQAR